MTEYPLYLQYSEAVQPLGPLSITLIAQAIAKPIPTGRVQEAFKEGWRIKRWYAPVLPDVGSMTTLFLGINFPSVSATSTIRLAILSFTDPPEDIYSTFPTARC